jgi:hypothetical protein
LIGTAKRSEAPIFGIPSPIPHSIPQSAIRNPYLPVWVMRGAFERGIVLVWQKTLH